MQQSSLAVDRVAQRDPTPGESVRVVPQLSKFSSQFRREAHSVSLVVAFVLSQPCIQSRSQPVSDVRRRQSPPPVDV